MIEISCISDWPVTCSFFFVLNLVDMKAFMQEKFYRNSLHALAGGTIQPAPSFFFSSDVQYITQLYMNIYSLWIPDVA